MRTPTHTLPRRLTATLTAAVLSATALGCGQSSGDAEADPAGAIPPSAIIYGEALVHPEGDLAASFKSVGAKVLRVSDPAKRIRELIDKELRDEDGSYAENVEPWLGDRVGFAITSLRNTESPEFVVSFAVKDADAAEEEAKRGGKGEKVTKRSYEGVDFWVNSSDKSVAGVTNDLLVVTETETAFKRAVDAAKGDSLADAKRYVDARNKVEDERLALFYAEPAKVFDAVAASAGPAAAQLGALRGAFTASGGQATAAALTVDKDAIRIESAAVGAKGQKGGFDKAPDTLAGLPSGSWLGAGLGNLGEQGEQLLEQLGSGIGGAFLGQFEQQLNIDVRKDLLSWMGEAGIFVKGTGLEDLDAALVVASDDGEAAQVAVSKLARLLRRQGISVEAVSLEGADRAITLTAPGSGPFEGVIAAGNERFVLAVGRDAAEEALAGQAGLGEDPAFREATAKLGDGIKPAFFLDVPTVVEIAEKMAGSDPDFKTAKPYLDVYGALVAGGRADGDLTRQRLVIGVK